MNAPLALVLLLAPAAASAGPIARLTPLSTPMSRPATIALQSLLLSDPAYTPALSAMPGLSAALTLSPDRARDRQALGPLAARLPAYYDASQLSLAMLSASAAAQEEIGSRVQRAVRAVERGEMSRRAFASELGSLEAYSLYGEPAANILGTARLARARLAAGERTKRVAAALLAGVRDDLAGDPENAVYGEYGGALPGAAPAAAADPALTAEMDLRLRELQKRAAELGYPVSIDASAREFLLARSGQGAGERLETMRLLLLDAHDLAMSALRSGAHAEGTPFTLKAGVDGGLVLRRDD